MLSFLRESRKVLSLPKKICIVLGNESCDLDSTISAVALAQFYSKYPEKIPTNEDFSVVLPVLNIPRIDFSLKTEVVYFLKKYHINAEFLTFKDDFESSKLANCSIILVDHHVSPFSNSVISVFDHRPFDISSKLKKSCVKHIDEVGSCCTLIANLILNNAGDYRFFDETLKLLYGGIILDTLNFSIEAGRYKELDLNVAQSIEKVLNIINVEEYRLNLFEALLSARNDVDMLDSYQILFKDLKLIFDKSDKSSIAIPGYPILVQDYIKLPNSEDNVKLFAKSQSCSVIVLIGMKIKNQRIERDIGFINVNEDHLFVDICDAFQNFPNLGLEEYKDCTFLNGRFFKQKNITFTRKHVIPLIKSILEKETNSIINLNSC